VTTTTTKNKEEKVSSQNRSHQQHQHHQHSQRSHPSRTMKIVPTEHPIVVLDDCLSSSSAQQMIKQSTVMPAQLYSFQQAPHLPELAALERNDARVALPGSGTSTNVTIAACNAQDTKPESSSAFRSGRWALDEKIIFLYALRKFGKGRWKKMKVYLPNR
jgi:hypothetical protein